MISSQTLRGSRVVAVLALSLVVLAGACQPGPVGSGSDPRLDLVDPGLTDPDIPSEPSTPEFSIRPATTPRNKLVVVLNGTGGHPTMLSAMSRSLATDGFHVIGLRYESGLGTLEACPNGAAVSDPDCHRRLRSEVVYGADVAPTSGESGYDHALASVTADTSVVNRLLAYVDYLTVNQPEAGWDQYQQLDGDGACSQVHAEYGECDLHWDQVVVMGFSQGAGVALYMAKHLDLSRVGMFSGPFDAFGTAPNYVPAPWLSEPFATDRADLGALLHPQDGHVGRQRTALQAAGLTDAERDVTLVDPPYSSSRRLITTAQPTCLFPDPLWAHNAPVGGGCTEPGVHAEAWRYLATGP